MKSKVDHTAIHPSPPQRPGFSVWRRLLPLASLAGLLGVASTTLAQAPVPATGTPYSLVKEANDIYLQARELVRRSDPRTGGSLANARAAIALLERAVALDPRFALAYVDMANSWLTLGYSDSDGLSNAELGPHARAAAQRALEIDPRLPEAHQLSATLHYAIEFDWEGAEREYRWLLQQNPDNASAHASYGAFLTSMGRFAEAATHVNKAEHLRPTAGTAFGLARMYYSMRRFDDAVAYCQKALERQENVAFRFYLGLMLVAQGQKLAALTEFERAASAGNNAGAQLGLAYGYAVNGHSEKARQIVETLRVTHPDKVPYRVAAVHLALGDEAEALRLLDQAYAQRDNWLIQLKVDPVMDPLRTNKKFVELMHRLRYP